MVVVDQVNATILTPNEETVEQVKITTPFAITSKRVKYFGINLTKE